MRVYRGTESKGKGEGEKERRGKREREDKRSPTSNHNLALCRVVSLRLEKRFETSLFVSADYPACARVGTAYKERARAYFHG